MLIWWLNLCSSQWDTWHYCKMAYAMMQPLNHLYSSLLERQLFLQLQIGRMRLALISMLGDLGTTLECHYDVRVFHPIHLVITTQTSHSSIGIAWVREEAGVWWSCQGGWEGLFYPPKFLWPLEIWVGRQLLYRHLADLLSCIRAMWYLVLLWPGWDAHCPFLCCGQLQWLWESVHLLSICWFLPEVCLADGPRDY